MYVDMLTAEEAWYILVFQNISSCLLCTGDPQGRSRGQEKKFYNPRTIGWSQVAGDLER
jgi:hypothetical protein